MLAALGPQHDHATHYQGSRYSDRVKQVVLDQVGKNHPQYHRRQHGDDQVDGKAPGLGLGRQADDHVKDLAPKLPDYRQDRAQLDDDIEGFETLAAKIDQVGDDDLVASAGDRQELRKPLDDAENQCLYGGPKIHAVSKGHARGMPLSLF